MSTKTIQEQLKSALAISDRQEESSKDAKQTLTVIDFRMVSFSLAGKDYGIDIMNVREIAKAGQFTYVPNTLPFVLGVYNLRGDIIPILDLRLFFNISVPERVNNTLESLLILSVGEQTFGVVVDKIDRVVGVQKNKIQPPHPLFGDINIKYISGVVEADKRLYVLLDIAKIFNSRVGEVEKDRNYIKQVFKVQSQDDFNSVESVSQSKQPARKNVASKIDEKVSVASKVDSAKNIAPVQSAQDLKFIIESLNTYKKYVVTPLNEHWVNSRFDSWIEERGKGKTQLQNESDADTFLASFYSQCTGRWWTQEYADAVYKILPENNAKQIFVWNPGCGKGIESYSLCCVLRKRYPTAKIRIYSQDIDLLSVSNAPLMSVPANVATSWYSPFMSKKANGEYTFTQSIKDSIMFEYHDFQNTNALPAIDIIFARDVLSFISQQGQESVINDFDEKLKGNGIIVLGENEILPKEAGFTEKSVGALKVYIKN